MATALHPQTILATRYANATITDPFGYPLRLRTSTKLGYKNAKWIKAIEVTNTFTRDVLEPAGFQLVRGDLDFVIPASPLRGAPEYVALPSYVNPPAVRRALPPNDNRCLPRTGRCPKPYRVGTTTTTSQPYFPAMSCTSSAVPSPAEHAEELRVDRLAALRRQRRESQRQIEAGKT